MPAERLHSECVLRPREVPPSREDFEVAGVFNPGAVEAGGQVVLMARVAERPAERRPGRVGLPRWQPGEGPAVDWLPEDAVEPEDPRVMRLKRDGSLRLTFVSHVRTFRSTDGRRFEPVEDGELLPQNEYELYGVEDPRIVALDGRYYVTYVAVSRHGAATALASTADFRSYTRHGVVFPPENKDVVLFPQKIGVDYVALHRPNPSMHFAPPEMWLARSADLTDWGRHRVLHAGSAEWEAGRIGAGPPPLETERGWLEMYHGNTAEQATGAVGEYSAGLLLLDREEPARVLARSEEPVLVPETDYERRGFVPGVVFPTGIVRRGDRLLVYYGAADANTGLVELSLDELLESLV